AIVFIQKYSSNTAYSKQNSKNTGSLANTGEQTGTTDTTDKVCNIYDMASNTYEWTTEYCTYTGSGYAYPCVRRGGGYQYNGYCTAYRNSDIATNWFGYISFRLTLYIK
ncbi:MAG: hypothetical protein ACI4UU_02255, partial [Clostridia bacterium]